MVRVPATCATAPWWLVHLGHEVGHVVDERLLGYQARSTLVASLQLPAASAAEWTQWSGELFADLYAMLMHGPWALWALATVEQRDDDAMRAPRDAYPPAVVRLLVLAHACRALGYRLDRWRPLFDRWTALVAADPMAQAQVGEGGRVASALLAHCVDGGDLAALVDHVPERWAAGGAMSAWAHRLPMVKADQVPAAELVSAREVVAAAVMRRSIADAATLRREGPSLAAGMLRWLPLVREPGTRAGSGAGSSALSDGRAAGAALTAALMRVEAMP